MKTFYAYSVKKMLQKHFGKDPVTAMRKQKETSSDVSSRKDLLALCWQDADRQMLRLFLERDFLTDTILKDDYIAYLYRREERQCAYLLFMLYGRNTPFSMDAAYAEKLARQWKKAGYDVKFVGQNVCTQEYGQGEGFRFEHYIDSTHVYSLEHCCGKPILVYDAHSCWPVYNAKVVRVAQSQDLRECECLFEPQVCITTGTKENKKTLGTGIPAVMEFLRANAPVRVGYVKHQNTGAYSVRLLAGEKELSLWVNRRNLICEISVLPRPEGEELPFYRACGCLTEQIPALQDLGVLDPVQMHGYVLQMTYSDGSIRNYYLKNFETPQIPSSVTVDGFVFDEEVLRAVTADSGGICFPNGYRIERHILFSRSYRQIRSTTTGGTVPTAAGVLWSRYLLPHKEYKSHLSVRTYWGRPEECYGPADALVDDNGKRLTDVSFYGGFRYWREENCVCVEPTGLYGYLKSDGTWLAPPVYESAENFSEGLSKAERRVNGQLQQFLITADGRELPFSHEVEVEACWDGLCPFNAATEPVSAPDAEYYWREGYSGVTAGKWGFVDLEGNVVVQPQYVYAIGFYNGEGRCVVAKLEDGKLRWGVIDTKGREVIPCQYAEIYTRWGDVFAFRRDGEELYGVMDRQGTVIAQPQFAYFEAYNDEHRLLTVGEHEDALGVYSLDRQELVIPMEFDYIDYGEKIIECEIAYTCKDRYFDYDFHELHYPEYDSVHEMDGLLHVWKGNRRGYIDYDGNVVVPPIFCAGGDDILNLYRKGYFITEDGQCRGLSTVDGREIVPPVYSAIHCYDRFFVASFCAEGDFHIQDTLFAYDGTPVLEGQYRSVYYDEKKKVLSVETPFGKEFFAVED